MTEIWNETKEYVKENDFENIFAKSFDYTINSMQETLRDSVEASELEAGISAYREACKNIMPALINYTHEVLQRLFTKEELARLIELQNDPVFKKAKNLQPDIEADFNVFANSLINEEMNKIRQ